MPRDLILGTAGHIDHGKTSLVKALTGIDCDRLPEEKARGITIDIGFALLELDGLRLGIVDVPGHERFIKNMLAGATGIDLALLVVAADDSVMPQTREHLEILKFLGVRSGVIALTKSDLVDATTREVVALEIRELVKGSFLENAPIIATSATTGMGINELKQALRSACDAIDAMPRSEWFRLPIDRVFVMQGYGTVVTGSVVSGTAAVGDEVEWHRADGTTELVRIRGLNNHGMQVQEVHRGQRAAVNLAGVPHEQVQRGEELAHPGYLRSSKVLTVRLFASIEARHPIKHRLPVRLHAGTAEVMATVSLLDCDSLAPGSSGLAQLFLTEPLVTVWGQPLVLRDSSAEHTLGGGQVLQPSASKIRRSHVEAIEHLELLIRNEMESRAVAVAWFAGFHGFEPRALVREAGIAPMQVEAVVAALVNSGKLTDLTISSNHRILLHSDRVSELEEQILQTLNAMHADNPLLTTQDRQKVLAKLDFVGDDALLQHLVDQLIQSRKVLGDARRIAHAEFKPTLNTNQRKLKDKIVAAHIAGAFTPPELKDFSNQAGGNAAALKQIFEVACAEGLLVQIADEMFLSAATEAELRSRVQARLRNGTGATVAEIRDLLGTTRKYAIPVCEYLDRIGLTRREGDLRVLAE